MAEKQEITQIFQKIVLLLELDKQHAYINAENPEVCLSAGTTGSNNAKVGISP